MIIFSDLHLREQTADVCFKVLDHLAAVACEDDRHIVCCGDLLHVRYQVGVRILTRFHRTLEDWAAMGIELDLVPGNHDQVDVEGTNALEVFGAHPNVRVWTDAGVLDHENGLFGFVPYRKDPEALAESMRAVENEGPPIVFAHFGIHGAEMNSGRVNQEEGLTWGGVRQSKYILGHYHKAQHGAGWQYVGSPYQTSFGEAGNANGYLQLFGGGALTFHPIEIGPRHYILEWDPSVSEQPPALPEAYLEGFDRVRLDIKASQEQIVQGKFKNALRDQGLQDAQVNVIPVAVNRELKMTLEQGETLLQAAERFARDRLGSQEGDHPNFDQQVDEAMGSLRRWGDAV